MLRSAMETEPYIVGMGVTNQLINPTQVLCYKQITEGNLLRMNPISLFLHFSNEVFQKKTVVYMMWHYNSRWLDSMIENFPSETVLLVSWSKCSAPRWCQSLHLGIKRLGQNKKKRQKKAEFNLHFKLTILFLDASTVQGSLRKPHIWGTFPLIFLLQNRRSFATPSYITQMQPKYEQKLTYLERHHKVVHQNIRGSYTPPSF